MHNYKELNIWKKSFEIAQDIYLISQDFPQNENYGLTSQIRRCAVSVPSNIAEGSSRKSDKDFCRFLEIALGSSFELQTQLELAIVVLKINNQNIDKVLNNINENQKMIRGFIMKLRN
ncbi:MAG: four helix bundle protein [Parvicella sp.]|jgi:four helix bundle protein